MKVQRRVWAVLKAAAAEQGKSPKSHCILAHLRSQPQTTTVRLKLCGPMFCKCVFSSYSCIYGFLSIFHAMSAENSGAKTGDE